MSDTGKQSPLGSNMVASLLLSEGLTINPVFSNYVGSSKDNDDYSPGTIVNDTCLKWLTYAINDAYSRGYASGANVTVDTSTYNNLLAIGQSRIPALGNSVPPTYIVNDPSGIWAGEATSGFGISGDVGSGQDATWIPYDTTNNNVGVTQWGYLRLLALQAHNDFYWNTRITYNTPGDYSSASAVIDNDPTYKDYVSSFMQADSFVKYSNEAIMTLRNSLDFLKGTFSNTNDLMTADVSGVSLSSQAFGQDLVNLGKALSLPYITRFGLPSVLLQTLKQNNAITQNLIVGLLAAGLTQSEIDNIALNGPNIATKDQEQKIYGAFLVVNGRSLNDILAPLNCKTRGLETLADLLNVKKLFPISFTTLTVPIYNAAPGPTNSKTYYLLYVNREMNPQLLAPAIEEQIGTIVPPAPPPVTEEEPPVAIVEEIVQADPPEPAASPSGGAGGAFAALSTGGGCVVLESYLPLIENQLYLGKQINQAYQIMEGFNIVLAETDELNSYVGKVKKAINDYQPCVRLITETGISLVCSTTAPIYTKEEGFIESPYTLGKRVAVSRQGVNFFEEVTIIEDVGMKFVRVIDTGDNSFWAGEKEGSYMLHHNSNIYNEFAKVVKK